MRLIRCASAIVFCALMASTGHAAETRGLTLNVKATEATDAPIVETVELYSDSHALVIGIDSYSDPSWPRLSQARKDARKVAAALKAKGFLVTLKVDLNADDLERAFEDFFIDKGGDPDARLFVWFAGHGHTVDGEGFLIPANGAGPGDRPQFLRKSLSLRDFGKFVRLAKSKHVFTVFDSCFSGTIFNVARSAPPAQIMRITTKPVRQFLTSGDEGQKVSDDGTFATLFVDALNADRRADGNGDGYLTASEIGAFLDNSISNLTQNAQTPRFGALRDPYYDQGDFVFQLASAPTAVTGRPSQPRQAPAPAPSIDREALFWQSIQGSDDAASYTAYLKKYPNGAFSDLARLKVKKLTPKKVAVARPPKLKPKPKPRLTRAPVHQCDHLAADPEDEHKVAPGVLPADFGDAGAAIAACQRATTAFPEEMRFVHQLARALEAGQKSKDAIFYYEKAANRGHAMAQLSLSFGHIMGKNLPKDEQKALEWARKAADKGTPDAAQFLELIDKELAK
ncbi:MAG: hypothetical protein HOK54_04620 [Alphaproteobacteria bacterium]|nr:hypothetical protein [Alphaproteobacteria bacterium]